MSETVDQGTGVITGASSGIGAVYADRMARRGYDLILVARNQGRLTALAERLIGATGRRVETLAGDLTVKADLARVEERLRTDAGITLLVNNAGVGATKPLLRSDVDKMAEMISLNITAVTRLAYAAAPGFVARGAGTLINIVNFSLAAEASLQRRYFSIVLGSRHRSAAVHLATSRCCRLSLAPVGLAGTSLLRADHSGIGRLSIRR